jgi:cyclopropane-fatty-acyl-phospholipid synthase
MLKPGMRVLDIGCGWGGLCKYLAEKYKVQVVGCTISQEGAKYAQKVCKGLPVDIRLIDYRDLDEKFDRIVSVGMFEHVGPSNYREFFEVTHKCLEEDGIFLLHTIGVNHARVAQTEPWFHTYIFPNGILPYHTDILKNTDGLYIMEDWQNMGYHYSKTLMAWHDNFIKAWPKLSATRSERFFRMWKYYLLMSAGAFRSRRYNLWQVVLSKNGVEGGYNAPR